MTLVDTSVWIAHFRRSIPELVRQLHDGTVACHPFVVGELALGHVRGRAQAIDLLKELPTLGVAPHDDVLRFVEHQRLAGSGIGWIDAHLLIAAAAGGVVLWTHDATLGATAAKLGLRAAGGS